MAKRIRLLVVEDEDQLREILEYNLGLSWFEVYWAGDGMTGIELARKKKPEVILLDWMMPEMDGLQVLAELKHDDRTRDIPVFMMTARGKIGDMDRAFNLGADDYITKPFKVMQIGKTIRKKLDKLALAKNR